MGGMTPTQWLILGVAIAILIVILLVVGLIRRKNKTISFTQETEPKELTQQEKSGNYQATSGFNFAPAKAPEREPVTRKSDPAPQTPQVPTVPPVASVPPVATEPPVVEPAAEPVGEPSGPVSAPEPSAEPVEPAEPVESEAAQAAASETSPASPQPGVGKPAVAQPAEKTPLPEAPAVDAPVQEEPSVESSVVAEPVVSHEAVAEPVVQPHVVAEPQLDHIDPAEGRLGRLRGRLSRSHNAIGQSVLGILGAGDLDEDAWEEVEDTLVMADLGAAATERVVDKLRTLIASRGISSEAEARALLREVLVAECQPELDRSIRALPHEGKPAVILVVGVNGTGKTTTTGKLARVLVSSGHRVVLGAADTFRAAAAEQLETWGTRVGAETIRGPEGADPASIAFDAVSHGIETGADVVLIDTAGRLHTKVGLMDQLGKVKRVVEKKAQVDEVILVLDATVGQNGLLQARTFRDVVDITGVALTKLDGTAKGGIVFQVQNELGVPVKLVGLGEGADHLAPFEPESFVDALLGGK